MKKLTTLFTLAALTAVIAVSCKKKPSKYCWQCKTVVTTNASTVTPPAPTTTEVCDMTEDDAKNYEKTHSSVITSTSFGYTFTTTTTTTCTK